MDKVILNSILNLWRDSGANINGEPQKIQYLNKQPRPTVTRLTLEYGVPKRLYTPNCIYEIKTSKDGGVHKFAKGVQNAFNYSIADPSEENNHNEESLENIVTAYNPLVISIKNIKDMV